MLAVLAVPLVSGLAGAAPSRDPVATIGWTDPVALARCAAADADRRAAPVPLAPAGPDGLRDASGWRLEPSLDPGGSLTGWRLLAGRAGARAATVDLPPASAVSGPTDGRLVIASDDGRRSTITMTTAGGCSEELLRWPAVIRQAVLVPGTQDVAFHAVRRSDRSDLGVWRLSPGRGGPRRVLDGLEDGDPIVHAVGLVWSTTLRTDATGDTLAVQSCGEAACRTRVLDLRSGDVRRLGSGDDGAMVGVGGGWLIGFSACKGLPCQLTATAVADGRQRVLAPSAWSATTTVRAGRMVVLAVAGALDAPEHQLIDPEDGRMVRLGAADPSLALLPQGGAAGAGLATGGGRVPAVRLTDGTPIAIDLDRLMTVAGEASR